MLLPVDGHRLRTPLPAPAAEAGWSGFIALAEVWLRRPTQATQTTTQTTTQATTQTTMEVGTL